MTAAPDTFTARTPEDLLALVPVVLGFVPEDSVAMVTAGTGRSFHARLDLPREAADVPGMVALLLDPARRHRVRAVFFVLYSGDDDLCRQVAGALAEAFEAAGIEVGALLRADGERWYAPLGCAPGGAPAGGVPYDVSVHPLVAQAVVAGRVTHASREALRATLDTDSGAAGRVVAALAGLSGDPPPVAAEAEWVAWLVARRVGDGTPADDEEVARLLRGLLIGEVRDAAWSGLTRAGAAGHVAFWSDVVRRTPGPLLAGPAAVLALAAWQAGSGALAWCALDRAAEADEDHPLARLVAQALTDAVPPEAWEEGAS